MLHDAFYLYLAKFPECQAFFASLIIVSKGDVESRTESQKPQ